MGIRSSSKRFLLFAFLGSAVRCQEEQWLFLAVGWRSAACAVKDAVLAFIGAQQRSLTGEARGLSAGFQQEGQRRRPSTPTWRDRIGRE
jgi:hypothetical protein